MNEILNYHRDGDYLIPDVIPPESPKIGIWGGRRRQYLIKYKQPLYTGLLLSGELNAHLEECDRTANEIFSQLVDDMAKREGVTEDLKASNQMAWVGEMDNIRERVEEIIYAEIIYN